MMLFDFLKQNMLKNPSKTLANQHGSITYSELIRAAEELAVSLTHHKYGILCDCEISTVKSLLACFAAKKTAVILSRKYGENHVNKIISSINITHLITDHGIEVHAPPAEETEDLSDVALIMCTSGTTGIPKGAMISEENLLANITDILDYFQITPRDKILVARPLYHCAVLTGELLVSLVRGVDLVFYSGGFSPLALSKIIAEEKISVMCATPTILFYLAEMCMRSKKTLAIKTIAISGECMTELAAQRIRDMCSDAEIYHVYGLTEASPRVSYLSPELFDAHPLSVGKPLKSLDIKIVEDELLIRGKSIMKGYYNNPELTAETIKNGWLHTGDIVERDESGLLYIKCRKDTMIIRGGMNVYPQEIESILKSDGKILDILVRGISDKAAGQRLQFDIVAEHHSVKEIMQICRNKLAAYQMPDRINFVDKIPKNASGKVIRS